ncbi:MAG: LacI family transcriptional regulator [Candidatus Marinimicrobia bacterium]|nr:LacI family transcriptional regulator [Candidatus Neomarinimicrobiota bacterium]
MVTLDDIAKKAGFSVSTVSRVLNGKAKRYRISDKTQEIVNKIAKDLNYQPNQLARGLRLKKTHTIGLVLPDISNPFFAHVARIIQTEIYEQGYIIIVCNTDENQEKEIEQVRLLRSKGVDGFLIMPVGLRYDHIEELLESDIPLVLLDRCFDALNTNSVIVDNYIGTYRAVEYLIQKGHRRIAIIQGLPRTSTNTKRLEGYEDALKKHDIAIDEKLIVGKDFREDNGYIESKFLLNLSNPPTAIFCTSDLITLGTLKAIHEEKLTIPNDISIISFDDFDFAPYLGTPLTAVSQPKQMMGKMAVKQLMEDINGNGDQEKNHIVLKPTLNIRQSVKTLN